MPEAVIIDAVRTPGGRRNGKLKDWHPADLAAHVLKALEERNDLDPELVDSHPTSMGRAIPFAEILVIGDDGEIAMAGEEGELVHCGPLVAQGYWQDAERTAERFRPAPPRPKRAMSA